MSNRQWEQFVEEYYERIFNYCRQFLGNYEEARDVTQQVFIKCLSGLTNVRDKQSTKAWAYSVARNCCIDRKRWYKRYLNWFSGDSGQEASETFSPELKMTLRKLIADLPPRQREIFILRHLHDFSTQETAQSLKISEGTVKVQLKRAVDKIKAALESDNLTPGANVLKSEELEYGTRRVQR